MTLWDRDGSTAADDDKIGGTYLITSSGRNCITFEWENASWSGTEAQPDVYIRWTHEGRGAASARKVRVRNPTGGAHSDVSFRTSAVENCTAGAACELGTLTITTSRASDLAARAMLLDSAIHALVSIGRFLDRDIDVRMLTATGSQNIGDAPDRGTVRIGSQRARRASTVTHEIGHTLMMQRFNQDGLCHDYTLLDSPGHSSVSLEYDSAAFSEGWAEFVRFTSWWNPANANARPRIDAFDTIPQLLVEPGECMFGIPDADRGNEFQVAKAFWDLRDVNNETDPTKNTSDSVSLDMETIVEGLSRFASGTGNRQTCESSRHGPNMWDYFFNNSSTYGNAGFNIAATLFNHNCLQNQEM